MRAWLEPEYVVWVRVTMTLITRFNLRTIARDSTDVTSKSGAPSFVAMVFHRDPLGIASTICVYILLIFGDYAIVYYVLEYGKHEG